MSQSETVINKMVEIKLVGESDDTFLKVKETLSRIGIANHKTKKLYQSCHILHKQGQYFIAHFKEMYALDNRETNISADDLGRRNYICSRLAEWGLVEILSEKQSSWPMSSPSCVKVLKHAEKADWELEAKYNIGVKK